MSLNYCNIVCKRVHRILFLYVILNFLLFVVFGPFPLDSFSSFFGLDNYRIMRKDLKDKGQTGLHPWQKEYIGSPVLGPSDLRDFAPWPEPLSGAGAGGPDHEGTRRGDGLWIFLVFDLLRLFLTGFVIWVKKKEERNRNKKSPGLKGVTVRLGTHKSLSSTRGDGPRKAGRRPFPISLCVTFNADVGTVRPFVNYWMHPQSRSLRRRLVSTLPGKRWYTTSKRGDSNFFFSFPFFLSRVGGTFLSRRTAFTQRLSQSVHLN